MAESKTSIKRLEAARKQAEALDYRKQGKTLQWIADKLEYASPAGAHHAIMSALQKTLQEPADELRTLELIRLDALLDATWLWASQGKPQAIDRVLRIMERRAKLLGLDAPTKIAPTTPDGDNPYGTTPTEQLFREIDALFEQARSRAVGSDKRSTQVQVGSEGTP